MAYTNIDDPSAYFQTAIYTGAGAGQTVTNDGNSDLQPDLLWIKRRNAGYAHALFDSNRGLGSSNPPYLETDSTAAENSNQNWISGVGTDSFTIGINEQNLSNTSGTYVAWQWKVNGGTTVSLSSNINSVCQVNQGAGISIVKYTCTGGGNGQAVQHGLGLVPQVIITKNRTDTNYSDWITYHHSIGYTNFVKLNSDAPSATNSPYNGAAPTSSTYNVSIDLVEATKDYVSYVFAPIQGYSKFGSYVGNGNADGPFVYTGFKPAVVINKRTDGAGPWTIFDSARCPNNVNNAKLYPNTTGAEVTTTGDPIDFLSNGYKLRGSGSDCNVSGGSYIYMAFAENPFVTSDDGGSIPTTAR